MSTYVSDLFFTTIQNDLTQIFAECSIVKVVQLLVDQKIGLLRGYAFVKADTGVEAASAAEALVSATEIGCRNFMVKELKPCKGKRWLSGSSW